MKTLKRLQVFALCFCLYHLQINAGLDVAISAANANVVADQVQGSANEAVKTYKGGATGESIDADGNRAATQSVQTDGDNLLTTADYVAMLTMFALGLVASSLMKAKPKTMDIMVGAASGVAYIGSEIMAVVEHGKKDVDQQITMTLYSDGQMDHEQIKTLEKQKQDYKNIEDTAKIKMMLQMAAAAGFTAAAGIALYRWMKGETTRGTCEAAIKMAMSGGLAACNAAGLGMSAPSCGACAAALGTVQTTLVEVRAGHAAPGDSMAQKAKHTTDLGKINTGVNTGPCLTPPAVGTMYHTVASTCNIVQQEAQDVTAITEAEADLTFPVTFNDSRDGLDEFVFSNPALMASILDMNNEMFHETNIQLSSDVEGLLNQYFEKQQRRVAFGLDIRKFSDDQIDGYIAARDYERYLNGEVTSISLEEYNNFSSAFRPEVSKIHDYSLSQVFTKALDMGVDLLVPKVQAEEEKKNSMLNFYANSGKGGGGIATKMGLGAAAAGVLIGMRSGAHRVINKFLASPHRRAIVWAAMALFAGSAAAVSNKIAGKMNENAGKIDTLLNKMRNLDNSNIDSIATKNQDIYKTGTFPITGHTPVNVSNVGSDPIPCANGGKVPCNSISGDLEKTTGFIELNTGFASAAKLASAIADGVQGQSTLSGATLDNAGKLANSLGALKNRNRSLQDQINKLRLKQGLKGVDLDANAKKMADAMANNTRRNLASGNGRDLLASYGNGYGGLNPNDLQSELANVPVEEEAGEETETIFTSPSGGAATAGTGAGGGGDDFNWGLFGADTSSSGIAGLEGDPTASNLDEFEEAADDIVGNKDVTIWKVISTRYLKSGYSRLLEEIK